MNIKQLPPISQARTSWELYEDIIEAIDAEPSRVNMNYFISDLDEYSSRNLFNQHIDDTHEKLTPDCHTQGCVAGWSVIQAGKTDLRVLMADEDIAPKALRLLPKSVREDAKYLFYGSGIKAEYPFPSNQLAPRAYADAVIANIRKFMAKHEKALKAHKLTAKERTK